MKRTNYHVLYKNKRWEVHVGGMVFDTKEDAVDNTTKAVTKGCELIIHNKKDGKITARGKSTYGNDPKGSKG